MHNTLEQCLDTLNERAAAVIRARYYDGQTSAQERTAIYLEDKGL